ncbi:non-ribosomal peptide synthetase [Paenibacillus bovis]|uniref:Non-ribosomal peptide synthetase n=1 Tax=Paenibacillus bovis TaxID=1616788 RepID=A0A172ZL60_9BACL|nr:non-ribosomal peptide synthetase [Paenibacillus bovis]ANF97987.1 non-ribosomal peptide synthetase [Paenibacillus bovis]
MQLYSLTNAQQRIWYTELLYPGTSASQLSATIRMTGKLNLPTFMKAINLVIRQYDAFRLRITTVEGEPRQYVVPYEEQQFECVSLEDFDSMEHLEAWLDEQKRQPLPVMDSCMYRFLFVRISEEEYWLNIKVHHIISDGISMVLFGNQFTDYYIELMQGKEPVIPEDCSYIDYLTAEEEYVESEKYAKDRAYWMDKFADIPEVTGWKSYNPMTVSTAAVREHFEVPGYLKDEIHAFCRENRISLFQLFMSSMYVYMHKMTNQQDIVIGTSLANRRTKKEKQTMGMFVSTIAERALVDKDMQLLDFVKGVARGQMSVLRHQQYPYNQLIQDLRDAHHHNDLHRLFGVSMEYRPISWVDLEGIRILTDYDFCGDEINDLVLHITEMLDENRMMLHVDYRKELFDHAEIANMVDHLGMITAQIVRYPEMTIGDVSLLSEAEQQQVLSFSQMAEADYPREQNIHGLFEQQVQRTPQHIAVQIDEHSLTYQQLNEQANRVAYQLRAHGIGADSLVGVIAERSLDMVVGMLAVLKAGGAYVPVDPEYPEERIRYILEDSGVQVVLSQEHLQARIPFDGIWINIREAAAEGEAANLPHVSGPRNLAYVIYTSGTTGKPKGTLIEHKNVVRLLFNDRNLFDFDDRDVWTMFHSFCFDFSVWEMYGALLYGGKLIIVPSMVAKSPESFLQLLKQDKVTILNQTPTYFYQLMQAELAHAGSELNLRKIIFGGEALSPYLLKDWHDRYPNTQLINMYGITETTVHVTYKEIGAAEIAAGKSNIGVTIPTLSAYILDEQRRLQPVGIPGELHIAGDGLARGYLNRPETTAEKFIEHPFQPGERMYRTGDLARWLPDGNLEYLGRIDHQVKIRGYRIELGEVEAQILRIPSVLETIVLARPDEQGQDLLCAYYTASAELPAAEIRQQLTAAMPAYMVPSYFIQLDRMPLTSNGKLDRRALPEPVAGVQSAVEYVAPNTPEAIALAALWQDILGVQRVGMLDNFFESGGHSLRAAQLSSRIQQEFGCVISLRDIFQAPTLENMSLLLQSQIPTLYESIAPAAKMDYYPVSSAQKRLYVLSQLEGGETSYNMPGAFMMEGTLDTEQLQAAFRALIRRHESLRTSFHLQNGEPVQQIHEQVEFTLDRIEADEAQLDQVIEQYVRAFDLSQAPLLRAGLVSLGAERHLLLFDMHHIVSDGISIAILTEELSALYEGETLPELAIQYKDYAVWQREQLEQQRMKEMEAAWLSIFEEEIPALDLPTDYVRPAVRHFAGNRIDFAIGLQESEAIQQLTRETGTTLYMVLLAAYSILLHKYTGQNDLVIGSPVAGRPQAELEGTIGMFVNTLAMRVRPEGTVTFRDYLAEVRETVLHAFDHQEYPFDLLVDRLQLDRDSSRNPVFDTLFVLQNMDRSERGMGDLRFTPYPQEAHIAKFDLSLNAAEEADGLAFSLEYATSLYRRESIERLAAHFLKVMESISADPSITLNEIEIITLAEKQQILEQFNDTQVPYPRNSTIHELFVEQVKRTPDQIALVSGDRRMTYYELEQRSAALARTLLAQGLQPEEPVAVMSTRSMEMVVALLGILRAGGAYVPVDPEYPEDRVQYMLSDGGVKLMLVQDWEMAQGDFGVTILNLHDKHAYTDGHSLSQSAGHAESLAYLMYTSGTTGRPKGVMIEHRNVVRLVKNTDYVELNPSTRILQTGSVSFDASTFEIWGALLNGGRLYLADNDVILVAEQLKEAIRSWEINTMWLTSPLFNQLTQQDDQLFSGVHTLIVGGDVLSVPHVNRTLANHPQLTIVNGYGPTENTTFSTTHRIAGPIHGSVPIGRPIHNSTAYVVDKGFHLQPVGTWGELLVGGDGVGRGYLNQPEMTADKFLKDIIRPGEICYRTGDMARWLPDGTIEYKGRIDEQVKIRGYRIELPEIEAQILKLDAIRETAVIVHLDENGQKQLCAYYAADSECSPADVRHLLSQQLPGYLIPSYFVQVDRIPLTVNGKVDRRALPAPQTGVQQSGRTYTAPQTPAEQALARVWQEVLGTGPVGVHDHFFELGGDSIKAIQVSSRLLQAGYRMEMKQLFKYSTIAQLAPLLQSAVQQIDQSAVEGEMILTPVQRWFFGRNLQEPQHFNQAVMLYRAEGFDESLLEQAAAALVAHHDVLRAVFTAGTEGYTAWNRAADADRLYSLMIHDLRGQQQSADRIEQLATDIQSDMNLSEGPLVKLGIMRCDDGDHLLIAIHHLVVDGVSWRILLEDLAAAYEQAAQGQRVQLPLKTHSFREWGQALVDYVRSPQMSKHRNYWLSLQTEQIAALPADHQPESLKRSGSRSETIRWNTEETDQLLRQAHYAYQTETNDLLLAALGMALSNWSGQNRFLVNLEGHGREQIIPDMDITRTVGWFTTQYPFLLQPVDKGMTADWIKGIKEGLRRIPGKGIGYGLLTRMDEQLPADYQALAPEISFNYLGQFDQDLSNNGLELSPYSTGEAQSLHDQLEYKLDLNGAVVDGQLEMTITYHGEQYESSTIRQLADQLENSLREVLQHCLAQEYRELTLSDIMAKGISNAELEELVQHTRHIGEIQNIYNLTPMQKGMLFHHLLEPQDGAYFEQAAFDVKGSFEPDVFGRSLNLLVSRHDILRTNFHTAWGSEPLQTVFRDRPAEQIYEDLRGMSEDAQIEYMHTFANRDKTRGFDLAEGSLLRISILRTGEESFRLIWSFHHIIMDGWCIPLITREVFDYYFAYIEGKEPELHDVPPYSEYIEWLEQQDHEEAAGYWSRYLEGYRSLTTLPAIAEAAVQISTVTESATSATAQSSDVETGYIAEQLKYSTGESLTAQLEQVAREHGVTMNILMQSVWGVALQRYNHTHDVVYGTVVSGRPAEIHGVEQMIGLFINTIPVRVQTAPGMTFPQLMKQQQEQYVDAQPYSTHPLFEIQAATAQKQELVSHILVFENYPVEQEMEQNGGEAAAFEIKDAELQEQTNYDFNLVVLPGRDMQLMFQYNAAVYSPDDIERIQQHVVYLLEQVADQPQIAVDELTLIDTEHYQLPAWKLAADYPQESILSRLAELEQDAEQEQAYELVIVDRQLRHQAVGIMGELCMAVGALSDAVINQQISTMTASSHPLHDGEQVYHTGELARLLPDGTIEYMGRLADLELAGAASQADTVFQAPRTATELTLAAIWQDILGVDPIGIKDNFFDLGGHSLRVALMASRIRKELNREIKLREVFEAPTIAELAQVLDRQAEGAHDLITADITAAGVREYYPLSSAQKRLFILGQMENGKVSYNMPGVMKVDGPLDRYRLEEAFRDLIKRHAALRTVFVTVEGEPVQQILEQVPFAIHYEISDEEQAEQAISRFVRPFDLAQAPLLRVGLIQLGEERHLLLFDMHHIISDGVSMNILIEEVVRYYHGEQPEPLAIQYVDYAVWQQEHIRSEAMRQQEAYWLETFRGSLPVLDLPTDEVRPAVRDFAGHTISFRLDSELSESLHELAARTGSTLFMVLLAAYKTMLHKYTGQEDIVVGSPVAGRPYDSLQEMIGMFVGTLPLRTYPAGEKSFEEYVQEVKDIALQAFDHQEYPFEELVEKLNIPRDLSRNALFDTMFVLQNMEQTERTIQGLQFTPYELSHPAAKFDLTLTVTELDDTLECTLEYATSLYKQETIERMAGHFVQLVQSAVQQPTAPLAELDMVTPEEKAVLMLQSAGVPADYPREASIHNLFTAQAARHPEAVAVRLDDEFLTYRELDERTNALARKLRQQGVQRDHLVAVVADRSLEMIVGMLAILKAGGAYVPVDADYPEERIRFMLEDSGSQLLLLRSELRAQFDHFTGTMIELDHAASYSESTAPLESYNHQEDLAYVIYTSGTTGKPKGTLIEHRNVVRLLFNDCNLFDFGPGDTWTLFHSCCFDFSVWEMYGALLYGGCLVIVPAMTAKSPAQFLQLLKDRQVTVLNQTPTYFYQLMQEELGHEDSHLGLRMIIFGGEALSPALLGEWRSRYPHVQLINMYGITETTVHVTYKEITETEIALGRSNIGTTIPTLGAYILNEQRHLQPIGIAGEMYITGDGLARGYLNRPETTAEKFIEHAFVPGERMYRSGDLARWLPDGSIEYLGRIDHQVKIRGYRIELGEVESRLLQIDGIREAVVIAHTEASGQKSLAAYFTADIQLTASTLRSEMASELPGYMIPSYFVQMEQMPLTPNGKLDRRALPQPEAGVWTGAVYEAPRTPAEQALAEVWQGILGSQQIGIHDHFFDLGGDSIKAIQISSRLFQAGYKLEIKDLFKYPTIAELSPYLQQAGRTAEQGEITGAAELIPIQHWFFERHLAEPHHYNHAIMLHRADRFEEQALRSTMDAVIRHHDALRMIFRKGEHGYTAWNRSTEEGELYTLDIMNIRSAANPEEVILQEADRVQASFNLAQGPLVQMTLFQAEDGDHLLIVIHHLVVDGVSWRILFEDIAAGYEQALSRQPVTLPQKTDSYRLWANELAEYAAGSALEQERKYWNTISGSYIAPLPKDHDVAAGTVADSESVQIAWSAEDTELLLRQANRAYYTETNDLLLTALGMALRDWAGTEQVLINLEGHGREMILPDMDITRTVGWFTTQYPVRLEIPVHSDISPLIRQVKETLRSVPEKGIGYGLLKYLNSTGLTADAAEPEVSFNYLGQFDQDMDNNALSMSPYSVGQSLGGQTPLHYALDLNGMIADGQLSISIMYSRNQYEPERIHQLADMLKSRLTMVIRHCAVQEQPKLTPSDLLFKGLTIAQLDRLLERTASTGELEDVYQLTPMQKGMLFHSLMEPDSVTYFEQASFELRGNVNIEAFKGSLQALMSRHAILRTGFYSDIHDEPLQVVFRQKEMPVDYVDLRSLSSEQQQEWMQQYEAEDMTRGFRLDSDPLMRAAIFHLDHGCRVMWSFHHIIMDGWCIPIVTGEIFTHYTALCQNQQAQLPPAPQYGTYIEWLNRMDQDAASSYWKHYLADHEGHTLLPETAKKSGDAYVLEEQTLQLGHELTARLDQIARQHQVTVNTLLQSAWGIMLQQYNGSRDAVFGGVVSGRPAEIPGIEDMVGLFINTVPVRVQSLADDTFAGVMRRVQEQSLAGGAYDTYPLYEIQNYTEQKQDLISHIMIFENYPLDEQVEQSGNEDADALEVADFRMFEQTNYDFNLIVIPGQDIRICLRYNASVYQEETIARTRGHLLQLLQQVADQPEMPVDRLTLVTPAEQQMLLETWHGMIADYPQDRCIHNLFEEQALRSPDAVAAVCGERSMTFRELDEQSNRLANHLAARGLGKGNTVGLLMDRSPELIVSILAVLKQGAVFIPIDPEYPQDRTEYILQDSGVQILLTQRHLNGTVSFDGLTLEVDQPESYSENAQRPNVEVAHGDLMYMIYTSGTTGKPKGTMITHKGLLNYIWWAKKMYTNGTIMSFPLYSSISFDLTYTSIFTPLITGGQMVIYDAADKIGVIQQIVRENAVDILKLTPTHLSFFKDIQLPEQCRIRKFIVGGENLNTQLAHAIYEMYNGDVDIYNEYGPTETVVGCMIHRYDPTTDQGESVPIGLPADNFNIYLLNEQLQLVPVGVAGEMYISGDGVAPGYLNRPELTAERFMDDPFVPGRRMYRAGDLARRLPSGAIEYLGRMDHQVKIRGYRIELGEIEARLLDLPAVEESIVVAWKDPAGQTSLCAYFVADREWTISELREQLARELPSYMIPSYFVQLEQMPLTPNGKLDRKALPEPDLSTLSSSSTYVAPRTEAEQALAEVWQSTLGTSVVGIHDHFFELGGDSIKAIQVSSRLLNLGYKLEIKNLFTSPTIAELAPQLGQVRHLIDQSAVSGQVRLTPAQQWLFEHQQQDLHHFNQSVMLHYPGRMDTQALETSIVRITSHHDALRTVIRMQDNQMTAWNRSIQEGPFHTLDIIDLTAEANPVPMVAAHAQRIQESLSITEGPLMKLALFQCEDGDHLLIVIHHLVVDGISWRILLEDLENGYEQASRGEAIKLPQKTDAYRTWADQIARYADSEQAEIDRRYWSQLPDQFAQLPKDEHHPVLHVQDSESVTIEWSRETTAHFLKKAYRAYNTEANDLLLTALGMAVRKWSGLEQVAIILEGHGREELVPDLDISRTVGWFTSQYPVVLDMSTLEPGTAIKTVKEGLRRIPNKGAGYGILKYMSSDAGAWAHRREPEIAFNYLGQFDDGQTDGLLQMSTYPTGREVSGQMIQHQALNMNGLITDDTLKMTISYNQRQFRKETIDQLAGLLHECFSQIIEHCVSRQRTSLTPHDVLLQEATLELIEALEAQTASIGEMENMYSLTPMQKGMLFHNLLDSRSEVYFEQGRFELQGSFDIADFERSFKHMIQRHAILRTNFYSGYHDVPVQVVFRDRPFRIAYEDLRGWSGHEQQLQIDALMTRDKQKGFDLARDPLLRVTVMQTADDCHLLLWSFHHIIMDGWCMPLVIQEVFDTYAALHEGRVPELPDTVPYSRYIQWLNERGEEEASAYWKQYLYGYDRQTLIPQARLQGQAKQYQSEKMEFALGTVLTERLEQLARRHRVTMNILMQSAWGLVLQRYNASRDVVFGSVVSGRPAEIQGIESMIGLFINTVPVRVQAMEEDSFADLLVRQQQLYVQGHDYDFYPLYEVQAQSDQKQELISHIMVFENYPVQEELDERQVGGKSGFEITDVQMFEQTNYDFNLIVMPGPNLQVLYRYNGTVYDQESIEQIQSHLVQILERAATEPDMPVTHLDMMTAAEQSMILEQWNDTAAPVRTDSTLFSVLEQQAARMPHQPALISGSEQLSYDELNRKANALARTLRAKGVAPDQPVAIMLERSLDMMVGILAILKAGGAYVPVDPEFPEERIRYMLEDSGAQLMLTRSAWQNLIPLPHIQLVDIEDPASYDTDESNLEPLSGPEHLAYIIYTSGSTGQPKGVMIEHRSAVNLLDQLQAEYPMQQGDRFLQKTTITFDFSIPELFSWFFGPGTLVILPPGDDKNPAALLEAIEKYRITHLNLVPSMLQILVQQLKVSGHDSMRSLKYLFACGEILPSRLVGEYYKVAPYGRLENIYGPTEATVYATRYMTTPATADLPLVPVGKPYGNMEVLIVDEHARLVPVGVPGELVIGGKGLARGYLNKPELTAAQFTAHPYKPEERIYRTGDMARWLPDGNIEYLGRMDHQVKIRGYRIELGEIESQLLRIPAVQETVVLALQDAGGSAQLCAYFVATQPLSTAELRSALAEELPVYMIPSAFIQLDQMPLNVNGKLDRKALPAPEQLQSSADYVAPATALEQQLADIWSDVLGMERVGMNDNFFERGGHSLKVLTLIQRIQHELNVEIGLQTVFAHPVLKDLLMQIDQTASGSHSADEMEIIRFHSSSDRKVFCFPPRVGYSLGYYEMAKELQQDAEVIGLEFIGDRLQGEAMLKQYVDTITEIQPEGPYLFLGYSLGGNLAFEVARAMEAHGYNVSDVIMVDSMRKTARDEMTPAEMEHIVDTVLNSVADQYREFLANPDDREVVRSKMLVYSAYRNELINAGEIQANIHALIAEVDCSGMKPTDHLQWQRSTTGQYAEYPVQGTHDVLLDSEYVGPNTSVIRRILIEAAVTDRQQKPILS